MPQAPDWLRRLWPGWDSQAIKHLEANGWTQGRGWTWVKPAPGYEPTPKDISAINYLILEFDWGGIADEQ